MNEVFHIKSSAPYYLRDKNELVSNSKTVTYRTESISFIAPTIWSIVPQELENYFYLLFFQIKYKELESKLSTSVMQNLLATCWFFIINICGSGIKAFVILLSMSYNRRVFFFFYIFSPLKGRC